MRLHLPQRPLLLRLLGALLVVLLLVVAGLWLWYPTPTQRVEPSAEPSVATPAPRLPAVVHRELPTNVRRHSDRAVLEPVAKVAEVVIIMDDLGRDLRSARDLLAIDLAVTFSILPNEPRARSVAELARQGGREVMIHLPMEPLDYPQANPGENALFIDLSAREIRQRMAIYREMVPYAVGANNHMGSRYTADRAGMSVVLDELRQAGLFFVDSRTTAASLGLEVAQEQGVAGFGRDLFLDNEATVAAVGRELDHLIELALTRGRAVAICHPYPATLQALRQAQQRFAARGVEVVQASRFLAPP